MSRLHKYSVPGSVGCGIDAWGRRVVVLVWLVAGLATGSAQFILTWDGGPDSSYDGAWANVLNWNTDITVPGPLDIARFNVDQAYSVGITGHPGVDKVEITSGNVRFDVGAASELHIGNQLKVENATIRVANGKITANDAYLYNATIKLEGGHLNLTGTSSPEREDWSVGSLNIEGYGIFEANLQELNSLSPTDILGPGSSIKVSGGDLTMNLSPTTSLAGESDTQHYRTWHGDLHVNGNVLTFESGQYDSVGGTSSRALHLFVENIDLGGGAVIVGGTGNLWLSFGTNHSSGTIEANNIVFGGPLDPYNPQDSIVLDADLILRARDGSINIGGGGVFTTTLEEELAVSVTRVQVGASKLTLEQTRPSFESRTLFELAGGVVESNAGWDFGIPELAFSRSGFTGYGLVLGEVELMQWIDFGGGGVSDLVDPSVLFRATGSVPSLGDHSVGNGSLTVLSTTPVVIDGEITLGGGKLRSTSDWVMGTDGLISGAGVIYGQLPSLANIVASSALSSQVYHGGSTPAFWLSNAPVTLLAPYREEGFYDEILTPLPVTMSGALLWAPSGIVLDDIQLNGAGELRGPVSGTGSLALGGLFTLGDDDSILGVEYDGDVSVGGHTLVLRDADTARLGGNVTLAGGSIAAANGLSLASLDGHGSVQSAISGNGTITATGDLTLGDANNHEGFRFDGTLNVGAHRVTLLSDGFAAFLGAITTLDGGVLVSPTGFSLHTGEVITGNGILLGQLGGVLGAGALQPDSVLNYSNAFDFGSGDSWILSNPTANFSNALTLSGGTIGGSGHGMQLAGSNGSLSGHGTLLLPFNAGVRPVTALGGALNFGGGGIFGGTTLAASGNTLQLSGGTSQFLNGGTTNLSRLLVTGGNATVQATGSFAANQIEVEGGTLTFGPGTTGNLDSTSALTVSGTGTVALETAGSLILPTSIIVTGDDTNRGTLTGSGAWTLFSGDTMLVDRGALGGTGNLTVQPLAQLDFIINQANLTRDIINQGTVRFNASVASTFFMEGASTLTNAGTLNFLDVPIDIAGSNYNAMRASGLNVINAGTMTIGASTPQTGNPEYPWLAMDGSLTNTGILELRQNATLVMFGAFSNSGSVTMGNFDYGISSFGGGTHTGTFSLGTNPQASVELRGAPTVYDSGATFSGNGHVWIDGGTLHTQSETFVPTVNMRLGGGVDLPEAEAISIGSGRWLNLAGPVSSQPITVPDNTRLEIEGWRLGGTLTNAITVAADGHMTFGRLGVFQGETIHWISDLSPHGDEAVTFDRDPDDPAKGVINNHGLLQLVGYNNTRAPIQGTGLVVNHVGAKLENLNGLYGGIDMRLETLNHGTLSLISEDPSTPPQPADYSLKNPIYTGKITNYGDAVIRALETTFDNLADVWVRLGEYIQEDGTTEFQTTLSSFAPTYPHAYVQADVIENRGGSMIATGRIVVPQITNQALFTVTPEHLWLSGNFLNQTGATLHLKGRLNFEDSSELSLAGGSNLVLDGAAADVWRFGSSQYNSGITTPVGATIEIRGGRNYTGGTNWTTHGTFLVGNGGVLNRNGGNLGGNGEIRVLSGGTMRLGGGGNWSGPAGPIIIESGGTLELDPHNNANNRFYDRTVTNHGTANHNAAFIGMNPGTVFTNHGTWNDYTEGNTFGSFDGQPAGGLFENFGTFNKTATGTMSIGSGSGGPGFTNHGIVNVTQGIFSIHRASTFSGTSVVNIANGAALLLRDGTNNLNDGARFQGAGFLSLGDAGQHHLNGDIHADNVSFWGGTLHGTHTLTGTWSKTGSGGSMATAGTTTIADGATWNFQASTNLRGRTFINQGTVNHTDGYIEMNPDTLIQNHGTWNIATLGNSFASQVSPQGGLFENFGTFNKTAAGTMSFASGSGGPGFTNRGVVNVNQGIFSIHRTSTFTDTSVVNIASGATLHLRDGTTNLQDGARFQGAGMLAFGDAGQHHLNGAIHADNAVIGGGTLHGTHTLSGNWALSYYPSMATSGTTTIAADGSWRFEAPTNNLTNRSFINQGTVIHAAGAIYISAASVIANHGLWTVSSGSNYLSSGDRVGLIENHGTFIKTGANIVAMDYYNGPVFSNLGTVDVQQGTLQLYRNLAQHSGSTLTGGTWIVRNGATLWDQYTTSYTINQGDVTLHGMGNFVGFNTLTDNQGTLRLLDGKTFNATTPFTNSGTLVVGAGSSFATTSTFANNGTLNLLGSFSATGGLTNTGTFGGSGTFTGSLTSGGMLAPGESPGLLTITGNLTLLSTSELIIELGGLVEGVSYDHIDVGGTLTFGGDLTVNLIDGFSPVSGTSFNLFDAASFSGSFANLALPTLGTGLSWDTSALYASGFLSITGTAVPEPSTYAALAGLAVLGFAFWRRRVGRTG